MKRLTIKSFTAMAAITMAVVAAAAVASAVWIAATAGGTRWLLTAAAPLVIDNFSARKIDGKIIDHLLLTGVRFNLAQQKLEVDRVELRWKPLLLLTGTVAVQELTLNGVRIQDDAPPDNKPPVLAWPRVSQFEQLFDGTILRLRVTDLMYRRLREQPVRVASIACSAAWQAGALSISGLDVVSPSGFIHGNISAGFKRPSLTADLAIALTQPIAEMDRFSVQVRPGSDTGPEQFVGAVTVAGSAGTRKLLELGGDIGMARKAINLRRLHLTRPGQKGLVTGDGSLTFTNRESVVVVRAKATGLDLAPELNVPTDLSGILEFAGTMDSYRGTITIANKARGWQAATVSAVYNGTREGVKLAPLTGSVLDGSVAGNLEMNWREGFALQGSIRGKNLNPARIAPTWKGIANFTAAGKLAWSGKEPLTGSVSGALLESSLHGQALTGEVKAHFAGNDLFLTRLALQGKGFDLHAAGELKQRVVIAARITDFSRLVPGAAGTLQADGWVRWRDRLLSGSVAATGSTLSYNGTRIAAANLTARLNQDTGSPLHIAASLRDVIYEGYTLNAVTVAADGTLSRHSVSAALHSAGAEARLTLAAGYNAGIWKGKITRLAGSDRNGTWAMTSPAVFSVSTEKVSLSPLTLSAGAAEHLEVAADLALNPLSGQVRAQWDGLNLSRANPYLKDVLITGKSHGAIRIGFLSGKRLTLAGSAFGNGTFSGQGSSMTIRQSRITFDGGEQGMRADIELSTADGGSLKGNFSSTDPLRLTMPEKGKMTTEVSGIDLALFKPWFPPDTVLEGHISGRARGSMLPGQRFELDGTASVSGGKLHQQRPDGELNLAFASATASWGWRGETLSGDLSLTMAEYGQARGNFKLPVPARFPVAVNPTGPIRASLVGKVQEKGIITAMFPGLVQESSGDLDADLGISGTWEAALVEGKLQLAKAGAYLPTAGIHLKDVQLTARLKKNLIIIDSFKAVSGPGHIEGTALISLTGWQVTNYRGTIRGENFQAVFFPELQVLSTPNLTFEGTPQKITMRGELRLPDVHIIGAQTSPVVAPSSDVIREGRVVPVAKASPLVMDVRVRLLLGDQVFIKVSGIDAQLGGAMDLSLSSLDRITSKGEIKVVKGRYRTYGVNLEIVRGRLFFAGGPVNRPSLDFLALRTVGDVRAGVTVAGTLQRPVTKLYSEPAMPDVDILAYIVLGHPLGSSGEQAGLMAQAAGALLTSSKASVLQDQLKNRLGLSTLEIQGGVRGSATPMGYKPLQVTAPGAIPAPVQPGISETVLTVGKFLTPRLYISYGRSLFTGTNLFLLRYDIFKQWQIESQTGSESGVDLFYKLEFK